MAHNTQVPDPLDPEEQAFLLAAARQALEDGVFGRPLRPLDPSAVPPRLQELGTSFVTLTSAGELRGCIGGLEAKMPLIEDVRLHAIAAALEDYRFPPVRPEELPAISISISRLTTPRPLAYRDPLEMAARLRPGMDGVVLVDGMRRATFLPQVWEKVPDRSIFLGMLCQKMGAPADLWRKKPLQVLVYQVEELQEPVRSG